MTYQSIFRTRLVTHEVLRASILAAAMTLGAAGPTFAQGQAPAYQPAIAMFDGGNSVVLPSAPSLDVDALATLELWVAPRWKGKLDYDPFLVSYIGQKGLRFGVVMGGDQKAIGIMAGERSDYVEFDFADGRMHHVAFVFVQGRADVYIDGAFADKLAISIADMPASNFVLGSVNGGELAFKGALADVRLWNAALDEATIATWRFADPLAQGGRHPAVESLVGQSVFANGQRGFVLTEPEISKEMAALLEESRKDEAVPDVLTLEDAP